MKTRLAAALPLLAGLLLALSTAHAQTVELKLSHWVPPTHPWQTASMDWGKSVTEASKGSIKVSVFPAQQLGKAFDHYDMTAKGIADVAIISTGYQAGRMLVTAAAQLPFLINNAGDGSKAFDEWYRPYAAKDMPGLKMCFMFLHDPGTLHSKVKITHPDQIKGMKIRPAHATMGAWMTQLGGTMVNVSAPESREALERGVADAITFPWASIYSFGIDKTTKFHIDAPMYVASFGWIMNPAKYDGMTAAQKNVIDSHCTGEWAHRVGKFWGDWEAAGRAKMKADPAHTTTALSAAELAAWRKSAEPLYGSWKEEVRKGGYNPDKVLGDLEATLKKYNSKY